MAKLLQLLSGNEINKIMNTKFMVWTDLEKPVIDLTVQQLSDISLILINTEYNGEVPACTLCVEALSILTRRAKEKGIGVFKQQY